MYNEKLNIKNISPNQFGYNLLNKRFNCGIKELEFENIIKPYINKIYKIIIENQFIIESSQYKLLIEFDILKHINLDLFTKKCKNYYTLILNIKEIVYINTGIELLTDILGSLAL